MRATTRISILIAVVLAAGVAGPVSAEEADDLTCRSRVSKDALAILDSWVNARIRETIEDANRRGGAGCDAACLFADLRGSVGASYPNPVTMIPHSRFGGWINDQKNLDRCHLKFSETIYGAKSYNLPWMLPFNGRIIFVADSIRLSGRTVGLDKIDHFIREGLDHWRTVDEHGGDIAASVALEVGAPGKRFAWTESGVKGMALTGVFAYADLAAGYYGYRFWDDLLSIGRPDSYVAYDAAARRYAQRRAVHVCGFRQRRVGRRHQLLEVRSVAGQGSRGGDCEAIPDVARERLPRPGETAAGRAVRQSRCVCRRRRPGRYFRRGTLDGVMSAAIQLGLDTFGDVTVRS